MIQLNDREIDILKMRKEKYTLEQIGRKYGITRERVRQIYSKSLKKIKFIKELI